MKRQALCQRAQAHHDRGGLDTSWLAGYRACQRETRATIRQNVTILRNAYTKLLNEQREQHVREAEVALRAATVAAQNYQTLLAAKRALEAENLELKRTLSEQSGCGK